MFSRVAVLCVTKVRVFWQPVALVVLGSLLSLPAAAQGSGRIFNTVKTKLAEGKKVMGGTVSSSDPDIYCAMASSGWDFTWIEMQHSPLSYQEVARMIWACRGSAAMPFIRVPDATEGDIQKAVDMGAAGIIIPMVESMEKIKNAVKFTKYPPVGARSQGGGQYGSLWGADYRQIANNNIMIVAMIESPAGVAIADQIASLPGVDAVFAASTDLTSFSGFKQGEPQYEQMITKIKEATLKAGKKLGGPLAWTNRDGFTFFQGPGEAILLKSGVKAALGGAIEGERKGVATLEGTEKKQ